MPELSTPPQPPSDRDPPGAEQAGTARSRSDLFLFLVVPVALGVVFVAVLLGERAEVGGDLQAIAPSSARAGGTLPIRAFHFHRLERPQGPLLSPVPADAVLLDGDRALSRTTLQPAEVAGLEGSLEVPDGARGRLRLRLSAALSPEQDSTVVAPVTVSADPERSAPAGRLSLPLQRFRVFALRPEGDAEPPSLLEPRVVGGACVPETRCDLLVLVGEPAAEVHAEASAAVTPVAGAPPGATTGLLHVPVVTHGPESQVELVARRDGAVVARREVRLPVALASSRLALGDRAAAPPGRAPVLAAAPAGPTLHLEGLEQDRGVIVDAFRDGVWERTGSVAASEVEGGFELPFAPLGPGLWRIQTRTDPFSADSAATRMLYVHEGRSDAAALAELLERARREWDDPLADDVARLTDDPRAAAAFLLAAPELDLIPQPLAVSGHMQQASGLGDRRVGIRWSGAIAVLLAGILVAALVWRRGVAAGAQARRILTEAGEESAQSARARRRMALTVLAYSAAIALAFLAAAALLLARGG